MRELVETLNKTLVDRVGAEEPKKLAKTSNQLYVTSKELTREAKDIAAFRAASRELLHVGFEEPMRPMNSGGPLSTPRVSTTTDVRLSKAGSCQEGMDMTNVPSMVTSVWSSKTGAKWNGWNGTSRFSNTSPVVNESTCRSSMAYAVSNRVTYTPSNQFQAAMFEFVSSRRFAWGSSLMITLYALAVGIMADQEMKSAAEFQDAPKWVWWVDVTFATIFAGEVIVRLFAEGCYYFRSHERNWNIFDIIVAVIGLSDLALVLQVNLGFLRVCRALRAVRVLRFLRTFPIFRELRMMAESICCCGVSLGWAMVLMGSVMYFFAVVLLRGASESLRNGIVGGENRVTLVKDFGTLGQTMFSLTQAVSGGRSWGEFAEPFVRISPFFAAVFPVFIMFVVFGALNILTGIFVESTSSIANYDKELAVEEEMCRMESVVGQIRQFFEELDEDQSGTISFEELEKSLNDERVKAYFSILQMDFKDATSLFKLLDEDRSGEIDLEEFIVQCMWLKGSARNIDLATVIRENQRLHRSVVKLNKSVNTNLHELKRKLNDME